MNRNGDGWKQDIAVGVAARDTGATKEEMFTHLPDDDEADKAESQADQSQRHAARRRKRIAGAALFLLVLIAAGAGLWMLLGGGPRTRVNVPVRDNVQRTDPARGGDDVTAQAIAEVRSATASPTPAASGSSVTGTIGATGEPGTIVAPTTPVTVPIEAPISPATEVGMRRQGGASRTQTGVAARQLGIVSERNTERSIRCAPTPVPVSARQPVAVASTNRNLSEQAAPAVLKGVEPRVVLPPFGAMLPIRTMGALYTLRPGLARFELMRDVSGQGWRMRKGTTLIGQQQGGEYDRAYVSIIGFIDPESKRFVKAPGEVLGADGAPGLQGKRRQVSSRWARVLGRVATSAVSLGQAALSRGNSTTVVLPGAVAPELTPNVASRREFVEAPAGTPGFVMITDLPKEAQGVDADPLAEANGEKLTDEELAELLSSDSPEKIRAAMPRMTPELRRIAEAVLKEQNR
ncbi:MAG TPA: hypothetical protein VIC84_15905 [Blastocatellia bacterium]|jgi:hypothetical protein